ncbi:MAG: phosphodiester glycosidase family protein [Anaerolineae bacterium]|nr:phosphodiester glycosidase family protein [Anaerolineae bacterium]
MQLDINHLFRRGMLRFLQRSRRLRFPSLFALFSMLTGCTLSSLTASTLPPMPTDIPANAWETLAPGLERRAYTPPNSNFGALIAVRIDPNLYSLRAHYQPGVTLTLDEWRAALPGAAIIVNANFFDLQSNALGLVVTDGVAYGQAFSDRGALVQVQNGMPRVRSTILEPYLGEPLEQAVQAFPMLVMEGAASFNNPNGDRTSRRTVAAQDSQGRILLLATPLLGLSLTELSAYLPTTDMDIVNAVNLDGGGSTMMYIAPASPPYALGSFDPVPVVLAVYPR